MDGSFLSSPPPEDDSEHNDSSGSLDLLCEAAERMTSDTFNCKRRFNDGWSGAGHEKLAKLGITQKDCFGLGIIGQIRDDDEYDKEIISIFPTPSPQELRTYSIKSQLKNKDNYTEITKNRALNLFDSPDEKTGWSELGLKIQKPSDCSITGEGYFNYVADELVLKIFEFMPKPILVKCARICRRWKRLALDESLWKRLDLNGRKLKAGCLGDSILSRGAEVLRLSNTEIITPIYGKTFIKANNLQYLDLSMATISCEGLVQLLSTCYDLKKLSLEHTVIDTKVCRMISQNASLTALNLSMVEGLTYRSLSHIFKRCHSLEELNIAWIKLCPRDVMNVAKNLPKNLLHLNFAGCRENIKDTVVAALVNQCPILEELDISDSLGISEESVFSISSSLKNLQTLHMSRCYYVIPESLKCLRTLSRLHWLNVHSMMQEENLQALIRFLTAVQINSQLFSTIARPTVGIRRTSIWGQRVRDTAI